jgi:hypothetical protein
MDVAQTPSHYCSDWGCVPFLHHCGNELVELCIRKGLLEVPGVVAHCVSHCAGKIGARYHDVVADLLRRHDGLPVAAVNLRAEDVAARLD